MDVSHKPGIACDCKCRAFEDMMSEASSQSMVSKKPGSSERFQMEYEECSANQQLSHSSHPNSTNLKSRRPWIAVTTSLA